MDVLRGHLETQLLTPEQKQSELLFPAEDGGFRSECFLTKAFAAVAGAIGLKTEPVHKGCSEGCSNTSEGAPTKPAMN